MILFLPISILYLLIGSSFIFWLVLSFGVFVFDWTLVAGYTLFVGSSTVMFSIFADFPFSCLTFLELVCETSCFYAESLQSSNWMSVDYFLLGPDIFDLGLLFLLACLGCFLLVRRSRIFVNVWVVFLVLGFVVGWFFYVFTALGDVWGLGSLWTDETSFFDEASDVFSNPSGAGFVIIFLACTIGFWSIFGLTSDYPIYRRLLFSSGLLLHILFWDVPFFSFFLVWCYSEASAFFFLLRKEYCFS